MLIVAIKFRIASFSLNTFIAEDIKSIPTNIMPIPHIKKPDLFTLSLLDIVINAPMQAIAARNDATGKACREAMCAVIVVPIFAPIIIPVACFSVIIPAFTKPTTITVVAEED